MKSPWTAADVVRAMRLFNTAARGDDVREEQRQEFRAALQDMGATLRGIKTEVVAESGIASTLAEIKADVLATFQEARAAGRAAREAAARAAAAAEQERAGRLAAIEALMGDGYLEGTYMGLVETLKARAPGIVN